MGNIKLGYSGVEITSGINFKEKVFLWNGI